MASVTDRSVSPAAPAPLDMNGLSWVLFGHAAFQYLNAACELGLFEALAEREKTKKKEIREQLGLAERSVDILLLGCTSLGLVTKDGEDYGLSAPVAELMQAGDWQRLKDTVAFEQYVVYEGQLDFTESLRTNTNAGLRRIPGTERNLYFRLNENPKLEQVFFAYMRSWSELANRHLVEEVDFSGVSSVLDVGGGDAVNSIALTKANPHLKATVFDILSMRELVEGKVAEAGVSDQVSMVTGDMHADEFPAGFDCVLFAHQFVIWTLEENTALLRKAYEALPEGGKVVIFNSMSNDDGDGPVVAALDSVYFAALPAEGGMIYSWKQHEECLRAAGFSNPQRVDCPGWTPHGILVAIK